MPFVIFMSSAYKYFDRSALENLNCRLYPPKNREKNAIITFCLVASSLWPEQFANVFLFISFE